METDRFGAEAEADKKVRGGAGEMAGDDGDVSEELHGDDEERGEGRGEPREGREETEGSEGIGEVGKEKEDEEEEEEEDAAGNEEEEEGPGTVILRDMAAERRVLAEDDDDEEEEEGEGALGEAAEVEEGGVRGGELVQFTQAGSADEEEEPEEGDQIFPPSCRPSLLRSSSASPSTSSITS